MRGHGAVPWALLLFTVLSPPSLAAICTANTSPGLSGSVGIIQRSLSTGRVIDSAAVVSYNDSSCVPDVRYTVGLDHRITEYSFDQSLTTLVNAEKTGAGELHNTLRLDSLIANHCYQALLLGWTSSPQALGPETWFSQVSCLEPEEEPIGGSEPGPVLNDDPTCGCDPELGCSCSPLIIDLGHDGVRITGLENTVRFDIEGTGKLLEITWTEPNSNDAFLFLDRNANGAVDDGTELFGNATHQPASNDPNGFRALAIFDTTALGGNADGKISHEDRVFSQLQLWLDSNQDGASQPTELRSLGSVGVSEIGLSYVAARRRDRHGNLFRWSGWAFTPTDKRLIAIDVIFMSPD